MKLDDKDFDEGLIEALEEVKKSLLTGKPLHHIGTFEQRVVDVAELRARHGLTQQEFADALGIPIGTLRGWEQGRRRPDGPARRLLEIIEDHPVVLAERVCPGERDLVDSVNELVRLGDEEGAEELILKAWKLEPRAELARAFASLRPDETLDERCARFEKLLSINPEHAESLSLKAELALAAEDWVTAYDAISSVREDVPSPRTWAIVAAISRGSGAPDSIVRAWLKRALEASAGDDSGQGQARASITPLLILPKAGKEEGSGTAPEAAEPKGRSIIG